MHASYHSLHVESNNLNISSYSSCCNYLHQQVLLWQAMRNINAICRRRIYHFCRFMATKTYCKVILDKEQQHLLHIINSWMIINLSYTWTMIEWSSSCLCQSANNAVVHVRVWQPKKAVGSLKTRDGLGPHPQRTVGPSSLVYSSRRHILELT